MRTKHVPVNERTYTTGDVIASTGVPAGTLHVWCVNGFLGASVAGSRGTGVSRQFNVVQLLAVAAAVAWQKAGADPGRVAGILQFLHRQRLEFIEAELAAGRTFPVPNVMLGEYALPVRGFGMFVKLELEGPEDEKACKLATELDMSHIWKQLKVEIAKLPPSRPRGRRPKKSK